MIVRPSLMLLAGALLCACGGEAARDAHRAVPAHAGDRAPIGADLEVDGGARPMPAADATDGDLPAPDADATDGDLPASDAGAADGDLFAPDAGGTAPAGVTASTTSEPAESRAMVSVHVFDDQGRLVGPVSSPRVELSEAEWRARLTPEQFRIARSSGTERPFCGTLLDNKKEGVYACIGCGLPLFASHAKFESGTGWPSFFQPIAPGNVAEKVDRSHFMVRTEINCARCDSHLGHVFEDGPEPTGLRFCLNSESLAFTPQGELARLADPAAAGAAKGS